MPDPRACRQPRGENFLAIISAMSYKGKAMAYWIATVLPLTCVLLYLVAKTRACDRRLQECLRHTSRKVGPLRALFIRAAPVGLLLRWLWEKPAEKGRTSPRYERRPAKTVPGRINAKPHAAGNERRTGAGPLNRRSFVYGGLRKVKAQTQTPFQRGR